MSEQRGPARPRQVTVAAVVTVASCVLLVVVLFEGMVKLHTADTRESISSFLSTPPGDSLGLTLDEAVNLLRYLALLNGALAAIGAVFGGYAATRHNGARIGVTVVAALLILSATVTTGLLPFVTAVGAGLLWTRPARDWFAGREPAAPEAFRAPPAAPPDAPPADPAPPVPNQQQVLPPVPAPGAQYPTPPPSARPYGSRPEAPDPSWPPPQPSSSPAPFASYPPPTGSPVSAPLDPDRRPAGVTTAVVLTWVFAGVAVFTCLLAVVVLLTSRDHLLEQVRSDPRYTASWSTNTLLGAIWVVCALGIFWSLASMVLAVLAFRRVNWARIGLVASSAVTALVSVPAITAVVGAVYLMVAVATIVLLLRSASSAWFTSRPAPVAAPERPPKPPSNAW